MAGPAPPKFPVGPFVFDSFLEWDDYVRISTSNQMKAVPENLEAAIEGLADDELDTKYNNWTIRQIVHHVADSHMNGYIRTKWALTEASPLIKAYNESKWSDIVDATSFDIESSLTILRGLHERWGSLLLELTQLQMAQTYFHPQMAREVRLIESVSNYVWHAQHHTAQIRWVREHRLG